MKKTILAGAVFVSILFTLSYATQFCVEYNDYDKLHWTGTVDTEQDTLTIDTWLSDYFWNPQTPLVWNAQTRSPQSSYVLQPYDVPDDWDGTIQNWGFISSISNYYTIWQEGPVDEGYLQHRFYMGWGAGITLAYGFYQAQEDINKNWTYYPLEGSHLSGVSKPDLISITEIPEPASLCLLALGAFLAGKKKRA